MVSRINKSLTNFKISLVGQMLSMIVKFVTRYFFIITLGQEYLGLNGLFTNILSVLSFAELGIGSAINFSLYAPLSKTDNKKVCMIMQFYKKVYYFIGTFILIVGCLISPILPIFIKDMPNISGFYIIYLLFVLDTSLSYFFSYKRNLLIADQNSYVDSLYKYSFIVILSILQVMYLLIFKDFIGYLIIKIILMLIENILISSKVNRLYPVLLEKKKIKLDGNIKNEIVKNTKAMIFHKVGGVVIGSTDNIILSSFVSLISVGIYSNYVMIINAVLALYNQFYNSISASVGNLCALKTKKEQKEMFFKIEFFNFWVCTILTILLMNLLNPFIKIYAGEEYLFSSGIVFVLIINFYIEGMRKNILTFKDAKGLFWNDRYKPLFQALINLVVSIVLALKLGVLGVFLGTLISFITTVIWVEPLILFRDGFDSDVKEYYILLAKRVLISFVLCFITYFACNIVNINVYVDFLIRICICVSLPNLILFIIYHNNEYYKYFYQLFKSKIIRREK